MSVSCDLSQVNSALFCTEMNLTMASGQDDGGGGLPGPQDGVIEGGNDISEDFTALLKEIEEGIDLENEFCPDLVPSPQLDDRAHGKGRPLQGQIAAPELAPEHPQGRGLKDSSSFTGVECISREVSEIVEIERWPRTTSKAAAVLSSKTHLKSGLNAREPPDRGPKSKGYRVATARATGHDSDEEPRDPAPSKKTSQAAAAPQKGGLLDSDEEPWDPGPSSMGSRSAAPETTGLEGLHDLAQSAKSTGRAFRKTNIRKANTSNEEPRDHSPRSKTTSLNFAELPHDRGPNTTISATASLKSNGLDFDEDSDDEPRDRGPDTNTLQSARLRTPGLYSNEESPDHEPSCYETSTFPLVLENNGWRNEQTNIVSMSSATLVPYCSKARNFLSSHTCLSASDRKY